MADPLSPPPPVATLRAIAPEIHVLPAGAILWRIYLRAGAHPSRWDGFRAFGPTSTRFDHHPPPAKRHRIRAILYASDSGPTSLAEVFQQTRVIDRFADSPALAAFELTKDLRRFRLSCGLI